ncbi:MAG: leucine-rich repeat domain-containing protein [Christensenellales bacterium]|nr:leucine-rich repeat domain-containing protein [Christensenellales bacterium]
MLTRRFRRGNDGDRDDTMTQDGFTVDVPPVSPRPWHDDTAPFTPISPEMLRRMADMPSAPPQPVLPTAMPAQPSPMYRMPAGYAMVGRRVLDFADNGDGTLSVARCIDPQADDLDIQFEAGACPVTAIAPKAFDGCTALRRVVLPPELKQIGEMAFSGCCHLTQLVIPGGVQRVGTLAFAKCTGLTRVRIEPGVQALGPSCFSKCTALERVDVPTSLASFGGGVFFGCGRQLCLYGAEDTPAQQYAQMNGIAFDSQSWREDEELIYEEQEDGSLIVVGPRQTAPERIDIPAEICGRRIIGVQPKAFFACGTLAHLSIGANVREIGESAFFGCRSLTGVSLERGLEIVGDSAFAGCENLSQVTLPWGTVSVGRMAFFGCTRLAFVKMPATTRVADFAFDGCAPGLRVFGGVSAGRIQDLHRA